MKDSARYWIEKLGLARHPEGGYFAPAIRSGEKVARKCLPDRFSGERAFVSSGYYLLEKGDFSAFHRLKSMEIWHFFAGSPLTISILEKDGRLRQKKLGANAEKGESFQAAIEPGRWFGACVDGPEGFSLVGCTVAPGFEYEDFELAVREELLERYPAQRAIIGKLTRAG